MNEIWSDVLHVRADVTLVLGLVLAIGVTIHVLLTKREVASAVGWIGLVWFAPILGAITYTVFGVNRVRRRARRMRRSDDDGSTPDRRSMGVAEDLDALGRGIGRITARPLLSGTTVNVYQNGDAAYPPMLQAIAAAQSSIGLSSYIFRDDAWGGRFAEALAEAHRRGVAVRVLIDGIGGGWLSSPTYHRLVREGRHRRPVHALAAALADAVPQSAQPQEDPGGGWHDRLHRRDEHRR